MSRKQTSIFSFDQVNVALQQTNATADAAEVQGILCGFFSTTGKRDMNTWLTYVLGDHDPRDANIQATQQILMDLHDRTVKEIIDNDYSLNLLLPNDDEPLETRIERLTYWCQGFLFGMNMADLSDLTKLPTDAREICEDILEISKTGYDLDEDDETNEQAYADIVEYLRIGVFIVYDELSAATTNANNNNLLH